MKKFLGVLLISVLFLSSCNSSFQLEKRHYRKGFYLHHSASDTKSFKTDSVLIKLKSVERTKKTDSLSTVQSSLPFIQKIKNRSRHKIVATKKRFSIPTLPVLINKLRPGIQKRNNPDEPDPANHDMVISKIFGILSIILMVLGLLIFEASPFGIIFVLIALFMASFGLHFGKRALSFGGKKHKGQADSDSDAKTRHRKAKNAYIMNLVAILILLLYVILRVGLFTLSSTLAFALLLLALLLILYLLFRMGVFSILKD